MNVFEKVRGTIERVFQIGLGGPQFKNDAGEIDVRNATDAAFVNVRGADPVIDDDLATKRYVDALAPSAPSVSYTPNDLANWPGTVPTTVQGGLDGLATDRSGRATLEEYGALGDAVTDDAAIASARTAFNASNPSTVALELGVRNYLTTGMSIASPWPFGFSIFGEGPRSVFQNASNTSCVLAASANPADRAKAQTFSGLSLQGAGQFSGLASNEGLRVGFSGVDGAGRTLAFNCSAKDTGGYGLILAYTDMIAQGAIYAFCRAETCDKGMAGLEGESYGFAAKSCTIGANILGNHTMIGGQFETCPTAYNLVASGNDAHGLIVGTSFTHNTIALNYGPTNNGQYMTGSRVFDGAISIANGNLKFHTFGDSLIAATALNLNGKSRWLNCTFGQAYFTGADFTNGENEFVNPRGEDGTIPSWIGQQYHCQVSYASNADKTLTSQQGWAEVVEIIPGSESATVNLFNTRTPSRGEKQLVVNRTLQTIHYFWGLGTGIAIPTLKTVLVGFDYATGQNAICYEITDNNAVVGVVNPHAPIDPATLTLSGWFRGSFVGVPWAGTASVGPSGARSLTALSSNPVPGLTLNSHVAADFAGVHNLSSGGVLTDSYITTTAYRVHMLIFVSGTSAPAENNYDNPGLLSQNTGAAWSVNINNTGILVIHNAVTVATSAGPLSTGAWHDVDIFFDGADVTVTVDRVAGAPGASAATGVIAGSSMLVGTNFSGAADFDGQIEDLIIAQTDLAGTTPGQFTDYENARYGLSL